VPEWYFLPFYAILRAITFNIGPIDSKLGGVLAMFGGDRGTVRGAVARYVQGAFGGLPPAGTSCSSGSSPPTAFSSAGSARSQRRAVVHPRACRFPRFYFAFFLIVMPVLGLIETPKRLPNSITEAVLEKNKGGSGHPVGAAASPETKG
jgi:ubiquinol-cytochrome c reductase cytochrome b subunit